MLDFSQRHDLTLHGEVASDVAQAIDAFNVQGIVVGAFARDLHLYHGAGIPVQRRTEDIDFAFMIGDWDEFHRLHARLIEPGAFRAVEGNLHRLRHRNGVSIDLVPFGGLESGNRQVAWPPAGHSVMNVFGFLEALSAADEVALPPNVRIRIVSLPALALLKIVAWEDRHRRTPRKDAEDLLLIARNYLAVPANEFRLWNDFIEWTESPEFDYEHGGARMLGHDIRRLLDAPGLQRMTHILRTQLDDDGGGELPQEMNRRSPELARDLLRSLFDGLVFI